MSVSDVAASNRQEGCTNTNGRHHADDSRVLLDMPSQNRQPPCSPINHHHHHHSNINLNSNSNSATQLTAKATNRRRQLQCPCKTPEPTTATAVLRRQGPTILPATPSHRTTRHRTTLDLLLRHATTITVTSPCSLTVTATAMPSSKHSHLQPSLLATPTPRLRRLQPTAPARALRNTTIALPSPPLSVLLPCPRPPPGMATTATPCGRCSWPSMPTAAAS